MSAFLGLKKPKLLSGQDGPVEIRVDCVYIPVIGELDVTLNTFKVKVDLDLSWKATQEDVLAYNADPAGYTPSFVPNLVFANSFSVEYDEIIPLAGNICYQMEEETSNPNNAPEYRVKIRHRLIGTMSNHFEVQYFPFDVQNLVLSITLSFFDRDQARFVIPSKKDFVYVPTKYTTVPGFDLLRVVAGEVHPENFTTLVVIVQARRNMQPYLFRILLPLFSINMSTFSVYAIEEIEGKTGVLLTAMLSFVGMIYILSTLIPMAGKGTLFDQYAMASTLLCIIGLYLNSYQGKVALLIHAVIFAVGHVGFLFMGIIYHRSANQLLHQGFEMLAMRYQNFAPLTYQTVDLADNVDVEEWKVA